MAREAKARGVTFVVANISGTPELNLPTADDIPFVDIALDPRIPENTNLPYDAHPSATAHAKYAARLETFIKTQLTTQN
jgi:hypothetical protein